jgi:Cu+-exporting ATPase
MSATHTHIATTCYHCGDTCKPNETIFYDDKSFCCNGCQQVYALLQENGLCEYYTMEDLQRISQKAEVRAEKYAYLNLPEIKAKLLDFSDGNIAKITFYIPSIHCSSCIWLLENLHKLNKGIQYSRVDFLKKQVLISYAEKETDLQAIVTLLAQIGYEPHITLSDTEKAESEQKRLSREQKQIIAKIAVAGFAFGNIMLISFPEYFGFDSYSEGSFRKFFQYINFLIVLPAFFYSGWGYIHSAYQSIRKGIVNIDFPLALGLIVLLTRSAYEIFADIGAGYVDTLAGLIFFLLLGKWFQQRTYDILRYDRDFKAYFPVAVSIQSADGNEKQVPVAQLKVGDRIIIRNQELIPADSILLKGEANIDYSFVTGEAMPVEKVLGEIIYAGGKQIGSTIELEVVKPVSQSYLTELWNKDEFQKKVTYQEPTIRLQNFLSKYFTFALLAVAFGGTVYWLWQNDLARAINAFTAVLIIGCPCALALSSPFALGTAMRIMGKAKLYLKNVAVIEQMAQIDTLVFDKTGTITETDKAQIEWKAIQQELSEAEKIAIKLLTRNSTHPLSQQIYQYLHLELPKEVEVQNFEEVTGKGIIGKIENLWVQLGSAKWLQIEMPLQDYHSKVFVKINGEWRGYFVFRNSYRKEIEALTQNLWNKGYDLHLLSGDNAGEAPYLVKYFLKNEKMHFNQSPHNKWEFVKILQKSGKKVMMLGDGLNDAGALQKADVGIAVTENIAYFTPASDAILDASALGKLSGFLALAQKTMKVIKQSFGISLIYNIIGLSFAVQGTLSPLIAAILMPLSSVTVVAFTTLSVKAKGNFLLKSNRQNINC